MHGATAHLSQRLKRHQAGPALPLARRVAHSLCCALKQHWQAMLLQHPLITQACTLRQQTPSAQTQDLRSKAVPRAHANGSVIMSKRIGRSHSCVAQNECVPANACSVCVATSQSVVSCESCCVDPPNCCHEPLPVMHANTSCRALSCPCKS